MNEQDKQAFEAWCQFSGDLPYELQLDAWQAALEYARGQQEPVAKAVMGKREVSCHGPNRKYVEGIVIQQLKEIEPETLLYTHPAQPVQSNPLKEAMKQPEEFNAQQFASLWLSYCDKKIEVEDLKAVNEQLLEALRPFAVYGRVGSRDIEVRAAIDAIRAAEAAKGAA